MKKSTAQVLAEKLLSVAIGRTFSTERIDMPTKDFRELQELAKKVLQESGPVV